MPSIGVLSLRMYRAIRQYAYASSGILCIVELWIVMPWCVYIITTWAGFTLLILK